MIKKSLLAATLLLAMTGACCAATGWTTAAVNFRDGPGANYYKIGSIGQCVRVDWDQAQNGWYRVQWNGRWGWVSGRYVSTDAGYCGNRGGGRYVAPAPRSSY